MEFIKQKRVEDKRVNIPSGCLTALVTPFNPDGTIDWKGLAKNIEFQISEGVVGMVPVGTTGESPTVNPEEHALILTNVSDFAEGRAYILAGSGSNSTQEALHYTNIAAQAGCHGALLMDCYYNGPSSLELRKEYYSPIAEKFPELTIVPYIVPGRTGCALEPADLAILAWKYSNLNAVKEARGDFEKMREIRRLTPKDFKIISGDDDKTYTMMTDPEIMANGVISVISNITPAAIQQMCQKILEGKIEEAKKMREMLNPLFGLVTVSEIERVEKIQGKEVVVKDKFRNPDATKTMMQGLGMPAGIGRRPLGKMTPQAVEKVRKILKEVWEKSPQILKPIEKFYKVNISQRLADDKIWQGLSFQSGN